MTQKSHYPPPSAKTVFTDMARLSKWLITCWQSWRAIVVYTATHDVANIPANSTIAEDITVTGVQLGDEVLSCYRDDTGPVEQIMHNAKVTATDTVRVWVSNPSGGAYNPPSADYVFTVLKFRDVGG